MKDILDENGDLAVLDEGESGNIVSTFEFNGVDFDKSGLLTVALTLYDLATGTVLNDRLSQNVKDANGGAITDEGELTLELDADDNIVLDTNAYGQWVEEHVARFDWTWSDGDSLRTGREEFRFGVRKLTEVSNG